MAPSTGRVSATMTLLAVAAAWVVIGCRGGGFVPSEIDDVRSAIAGLIAADNDGDVDAITAHYAADAIFLPPAGPPVHGRDEIRRRYDAGLRQFSLDVTIDIEQVQVAGRWAYSRGTTAGRYVWRDGSPPTPFADKYLMILKRENGTWVVSTLMWSPLAAETDAVR